MTAQDIEIAVACHFDYRRNLIVPNVHWGLGLKYEADLVVLRPSDWAVEIEIKTTKSDIKADLRKAHQHDSILFRELWFAVPEKLTDDANIPEHAGVLAICEAEYGRYKVKRIRRPKRRKNAQKFSEKQRRKLYELASMRTWTLKQHLAQKRRDKS